MPGHVSLRSRPQWEAIRSPFRAGLLEVVSAAGGATARELAEAFQIEASLVHYHMNMLFDAGLVTRTRDAARRGQVYRAKFTRLSLEYNPGSKLQRQRARKAATTWLDASHKCVIDAEATGTHSRVLLEWENLTDGEIRKVEAHFKAVDDIIENACKRRRRSGLLEGQHATCHVGFSIVRIDRPVPVNPRMDITPL